MKFNKISIQVFILCIFAISLMAIMVLMLNKKLFFESSNGGVLTLCLFLICGILIIVMFIFLLFRRVTPKRYIYISYASKNKVIAENIMNVLSEQLEKLSKYRFEFVTKDSIPYGNDIYLTSRENMAKSGIVIIIVSQSFLQSKWCQEEFNWAFEHDKRIIPIILESFDDLSDLPNDIGNIKALSLKNCEFGDYEFFENLKVLAKDLIRHQSDK